MNISGLSAIVTGGASGLGAGTARHLAEKGAKVALFDVNADKGEALASQLGGVFCNTDISDPENVSSSLEKAEAEIGVSRIVVNCAGIVTGQKTVSRKRDTGEIASHDPALFAKVININLIGTFYVSSMAAARMATLDPTNSDGNRGVIITTSSVAAEDGQLGQAAYAASKAGIQGMMLPMARDLAREGIRTASILPGLFATPMFDSLTDEIRAALAANVPFPSRLGTVEEYARLAATIIENDMINGTSIRLDGALRLPPK
ncbi:MAG: SDR family NAD(P)-dependent oxidoreductase [Pseudomonadota bacterium]